MNRRLTGRQLGVVFGVWVLGEWRGGGSAVASVTATETFVYTGGEQILAVPAGVTSVRVVAVGGRGGLGYAQGPVGGFGGEATADLSVSAGQVLYVEVGGKGGDGWLDSGVSAFNGGAAGGLGAGGGGGGASDVRALPSSASGSLGSRLIIAGGGGGRRATRCCVTAWCSSAAAPAVVAVSAAQTGKRIRAAEWLRRWVGRPAAARRAVRAAAWAARARATVCPRHEWPVLVDGKRSTRASR